MEKTMIKRFLEELKIKALTLFFKFITLLIHVFAMLKPEKKQ